MSNALDRRQLAALVRVWLRRDMHLAGGRGAGLAGVAILSSLFMLLGALGASAMVFAGVPRFAFTTLGLLFGSMPTAMATLTDFGVAAVDVSDQDVVGHRPVSDRTYLFARLLTVCFYALAVGLPAQLPYALAGLIAPGASNLFPLAYMAVATLVILATAGAVVGLYAGIARFFGPRRLADMVLFVQLFAIGLFFLGGPLIAPTTALLARLDLDQSRVLLALPWAWAAAGVELLTGQFSIRTGLLAVLGAAVFTSLCWLLPRRLSLGYVDALSRQLASAAGDKPPAPGRSGQPPLMLAGYALARAALRDSQTRLRVIPSLVLPVLYASFTLLLQQPRSPLEDRALLNLLVALFPAAMLAVGPAAFLIGAEFGNSWRASWIFGAAPLTRPGLVHRGVRLAAFRAFLPGALAYALIASLLWPVGHALVLAIDVLAAGILSLGLASLAVHAFPASRPLQAGVNFRTQLVMFASLILPTGALIGLWLVVGDSAGAHLLADLGLVLVSLPIHALAEWRFNRAAKAGRPLLAVDPEAAFAQARLRANWWALGASALAAFAVLVLGGAGYGLWRLSGGTGTAGMRAWTALRAAEMALSGKQDGRAEHLARQSLARNPVDAEALALIGRAQLARGDTAAARTTFLHRARVVPDADGNGFFLGEALRAEKLCHEAAASYGEESERPRSRYANAALFGKAQALLNCRENEAAAEAFDAYLDLRPDDVEAWTDYAELLRTLGRDQETIRALASGERAAGLQRRGLLPPLPRY